jgi:uncharacterized repeat protein (TIGR01451 family)
MIVGLLAAIVSFAMAPGAVALADTYTANNFASPAFHLNPASVNGQDGWTSAPPGSSSGTGSPTGEFDQGIVATSNFYTPAPTGFGAQAFRISNAYTSGVEALQTFSAHVSPAGEGQPNSEFIATFSFTTAKPTYQSGLAMSISPDNGVGGRISWIGLTDEPAGSPGCATACTLVRLADSPDVAGDFTYYNIATLPDGVPHTITLQIKFNPGNDNDVVGISYDGTNSGQCFTTWENYLRANPDGDTGGVVPPTNSLQFRVSSPAGGNPGVLGNGFLFGNVSLTTDNGPGPAAPACDVDIAKDPDSSTVTAGGLAGFRLTATNHSGVAAKNLLLCDHIPAKTTFVSASRKLRRVGSKRCLLIRSLGPGKSTSVHVVVRVSPNAAAGTLDNIADITPEPPTGVPPSTTPPVGSPDVPPGASVILPPPLKKVIAKMKIIAKKAAAPSTPPPVTG